METFVQDSVGFINENKYEQDTTDIAPYRYRQETIPPSGPLTKAHSGNIIDSVGQLEPKQERKPVSIIKKSPQPLLNDPAIYQKPRPTYVIEETVSTYSEQNQYHQMVKDNSPTQLAHSQASSSKIIMSPNHQFKQQANYENSNETFSSNDYNENIDYIENENDDGFDEKINQSQQQQQYGIRNLITGSTDKRASTLPSTLF